VKKLFSKILRYGAPSEDASVADSVAGVAIEKHIETHVGKPSLVLHEIGSRYVHIDVHVVAPKPDRDFYTLVTSGMSDKPMKAPRQAEGLEYSELMLCLPSNWTMKEFDVMSQETWNRDWRSFGYVNLHVSHTNTRPGCSGDIPHPMAIRRCHSLRRRSYADGCCSSRNW